MKINFSKINIKKLLFVFLIVPLVGYAIWDLSFEAVNYFREQGYNAAVNDMISQAEDPECRPFEIFSDKRRAILVNVACLQQVQQSSSIIEQPIEESAPVLPEE